MHSEGLHADLEDYREWVDCWQCCGEGFSHHDCGEDCCCCLDPEPNVLCDVCEGEGGFMVTEAEEREIR